MIDLGHGQDDPGYNMAAKYLINNGSPVNKTCKYISSYGTFFYPPIYWAAFRHNTEIGIFLLEKGANPNVIDDLKRTLTMFAAETKDVTLLRDLIQNGAPVNAKDKDGRSPLHYAISFYNFEAIKVLVKNGCDINTQDNDGDTVLSIAAYFGLSQIVEYLLVNKADPDIRDTKGNTALMKAVFNQKHPFPFTKYSYEEVLKLLLKYNTKVNARNNDGQTALMFGCHTVEIVKQLLEKGADISLKDNSGKNAIDYAKEYVNNEEIVTILEKYMNRKNILK